MLNEPQMPVCRMLLDQAPHAIDRLAVTCSCSQRINWYQDIQGVVERFAHDLQTVELPHGRHNAAAPGGGTGIDPTGGRAQRTVFSLFSTGHFYKSF